MADKIQKVSGETKDAIRRKSAVTMPDKPNVDGMNAAQVKHRLSANVLDTSKSVLAELDRVVDEANVAFSEMETTTSKMKHDLETADEANADAVAAEQERAVAAESGLSTRISEMATAVTTERERAVAAESGLSESIADVYAELNTKANKSGGTITGDLDVLGYLTEKGVRPYGPNNPPPADVGGSIGIYNFGTATPTQQAFTDFALSRIPGITADEIFNGSTITNAYDGEIWKLANTPNTTPPVFSWNPWVTQGSGATSTANLPLADPLSESESGTETNQQGVNQANKTAHGAINTALEAQNTALEAQNTALAGKYTKPVGGIPKTDLSTAVQASLERADEAYSPDNPPPQTVADTKIYEAVKDDLGYKITSQGMKSWLDNETKYVRFSEEFPAATTSMSMHVAVSDIGGGLGSGVIQRTLYGAGNNRPTYGTLTQGNILNQSRVGTVQMVIRDPSGGFRIISPDLTQPSKAEGNGLILASDGLYVDVDGKIAAAITEALGDIEALLSEV